MELDVVDDIPWMSATQMSEKVRHQELSPVDIAASMTQRVKALNPELNAYVTFDDEQVHTDAVRLEEMADSEAQQLGPLHGVPFSIKELTAMKGLPATYGYLPLKGTLAKHDAAVVRRLKAAGGLFLERPTCRREATTGELTITFTAPRTILGSMDIRQAVRAGVPLRPLQPG